MDYFGYRDNILYAEDVNLLDVVKKVKTPFYVYSKKTILHHFNQIKDAFSHLNPLICFSVKSNSNLEILKILKKAGAGFDIVSGGELYLVRKIKAKPETIVFAGVGKTKEEIEYAIRIGIFMFNCESIPEIQLINRLAIQKNRVVNIAIRINPDIIPKTHKYITTGKKETKFGISIYEIENIIKVLKKCSNLNLIGLHFHIGSQITETTPYIKAVKKILKVLKKFRSAGYNIQYLNIGGGLGIIYKDEKPSLPAKLAEDIIPYIKKENLKLIIEPGRYIVGNAGILVTKVIYVKRSLNKIFVIVDTGMNTLIRPTLYEAYHQILPLIKRERKFKVDIVGPICETGDFFARDRIIPKVSEDEFIAVKSTGAYGMVMASRYNARPLPAEIIVSGKRFFIARKAEKYKDLIK